MQISSYFLIITNHMKRSIEQKLPKRGQNNFFRYVQPPTTSHTYIANKTNKMHSRSMIELDNSKTQGKPQKKTTSQKQNHFNSMSSNMPQSRIQGIKSTSLKNFLTVFGNQNSSSILQNSTKKVNNVRSTNNQKIKQRNHQKMMLESQIKTIQTRQLSQKEMPQRVTNNCTIPIHRGINENVHCLHEECTPNNRKKVDHSIEAILKLKKEIEEQRIKNENYEIQISQLSSKINKLESQNCGVYQKLQSERISKIDQEKSMQQKIEVLEKNHKRSQCREHQLIIQSLKNVINEQLKKIIELEKFKVERQEIQKLQQCIHQSITLNNHQNITQKNNQLLCLAKSKSRKQNPKIRIDEEQGGFQSSIFISSSKKTPTYNSDTILEQEYEESRSPTESGVQVTEGDSIIEEVDKYLSVWRKSGNS